jgi:hypothetical protein
MFSLSPGPPKRTDLLVWYHHISVIWCTGQELEV